MKALFKNIFDAPAATAAGAIVAALAVITGSDVDLPKEVMVGLMALSALLATFSGPNKS